MDSSLAISDKHTNDYCRTKSTQNSPYNGPKVDQSQKICGCKGVRSCRLCEDSDNLFPERDQNHSMYDFCLHCQRPWLKILNHVPSGGPTQASIQTCYTYGKEMDGGVSETERKTAKQTFTSSSTVCDQHSQIPVDFCGVLVIEDFVTEEEELALCEAVYQTDFVNSQSGRRKQDYGPKVNFKKKKLKFDSFTGLPSYSRFLYERMKEQEGLTEFEPVELCNLEYCCERGAHIDPHFDDAWLWGERLITLNLLSDSALTFTSDLQPGVRVKVPLLRRSLVVVQGEARHLWKHGICREDVSEKRLAMTFRELSAEFKLGGVREEDGGELLKRALTFQGCAVAVNAGGI